MREYPDFSLITFILRIDTSIYLIPNSNVNELQQKLLIKMQEHLIYMTLQGISVGYMYYRFGYILLKCTNYHVN